MKAGTTRLYGVADVAELTAIFTYEAASAEEAAALYLDDPTTPGTMVRVWLLGRHPAAFVQTKAGVAVKVSDPKPVSL